MNSVNKKREKVIEVLYEDDQYVAFNKPSKTLVIPTPKNEKNTLVAIVNEQIGRSTGYALHPCHRLDRDTSGVILFAKGKKHQRCMMDVFKKRSIKKKYVALIHGHLSRKTGELKSVIRDFDQRRFQKKAKGKIAVTRYNVVKEKKLYSIVAVYPETGRTNQIRIQFSRLGHPLLGDRKYSFARDFALKFRRTALHASELQWIHPVTGKVIIVRSSLAQDMEDFIRYH